jgi:hypothetical protein
MGYTHYWRIPKELDAEKFATLSAELQTAADLLPDYSTSAGMNHEGVIHLGDGGGEGNPIFSKEEICFNGKGAGSHETFIIQQNGNSDFEFCKTARKPYDLMVCLSLLRLKHHFPESKISSDGGAADWKPAKEFYKKVFGEAAPKVE